MHHARKEDVMTLDVKKSPSRGGIIIRDNAARTSVFVAWNEVPVLVMAAIDLHDRERQAIDRRNNP